MSGQPPEGLLRGPQKEYHPRKKSSMDPSTSQQAVPNEQCALCLEEWDKWFKNTSDGEADSDLA